MKKALVDIFIAIENRTFMKVSSSDKDRFRAEVNKRLHELMGMLELAKLMDADDKLIKALEKQIGWLIRRREAVR